MNSIDPGRNNIVLGDCLDVLRNLPSASFQLIYIDPPFNTGEMQRRISLKVSAEATGARLGFGGKRYRAVTIGEQSYSDRHEDYLAFLELRLQEAHRVLSLTGSLFFHIDYREAHYCKVLLDGIFGRPSFKNEIIWAYDFGGRSKTRWPCKHDTIFWYTKDPDRCVFNYEAMDRIPYMAPGLAGPKKALAGKTPTDVWWKTIVSPTGSEKTGYPNQKPLQILERIIKVHSMPGDSVLDFFAGSGTTGEAAAKNDRFFSLVDSNPEAVAIMNERLRPFLP